MKQEVDIHLHSFWVGGGGGGVEDDNMSFKLLHTAVVYVALCFSNYDYRKYNSLILISSNSTENN